MGTVLDVLSHHAITQTWNQHLRNAGAALGGIDWAMPIGTFLPPPPGTVRREWVTPSTPVAERPRWYNTGLGNAVAWVRENGTRTVYGHGSGLDPHGFLSGNSGKTTGPHVHIHDVLANGYTRAQPFSTITTAEWAGGGTTPFDNRRKTEKMIHFYTNDGPAGSNGLRYHILHSGGVYTYTSGGQNFPNAVAAQIGSAIQCDAAFIEAMKRQHADQNPGGVTNVSGGAVDVAALIAALEKLGEGLEEKLDKVLAATKALNPPG